VQHGGRSYLGGVVSLRVVSSTSNRVLFDDVSIERNVVQSRQGAYSGAGGIIGITSHGLDAVFNRVTVRGNRVEHDEIPVYGGVWAVQTLDAPVTARITECLVQDNHVSASFVVGGVVMASAYPSRDRPDARVDLTLDRSLVAGNTVTSLKATHRATNDTTGLLNTHRSVTSGDHAHVTVQNSTIHGNRLVGPMETTLADGNFVFVNSTITDNAAQGADSSGQQLRGNVSAYHSVFSGNNAGTEQCSEFGQRQSVRVGGQYNWFNDPHSCVVSDDEHTTFGQSPELGPLADNGGPTLSRAPSDTSPLIDAGNATCSVGGEPGPTLDQRSMARPRGAACDLGSVELR
jgi:hypothetical protein